MWKDQDLNSNPGFSDYTCAPPSTSTFKKIIENGTSIFVCFVQKEM